MVKKLLAFLLTFALLLSTVTSALIASSAEEETAITAWDGTIATAFAGGDGTKENPYQISNGAELAYMFNSVITEGSSFSNNKYFKLTADVYLNDVTQADWKDNNPNSWLVSKYLNGYRFTGNFDGAGHTVYGIYYSGDAACVGLLPVTDTYNYDVVISNLNISDSYISSTANDVAVIVPYLYGGTSNAAHFYNVKVTDSVEITAPNASGFVGAIQNNVINLCQFSGCAMLGSVSTGNAFVGAPNRATIKIVQSYATSSYWYPNYNATTSNTYLISDVSTIIGKDAAKAAMPGLDWLRIWNCTAEGTPCPMDYNTNNVTGHIWTGLVAHQYASGSGTEEDPYIIQTPEQLAKAARACFTSGKYYKIVRDLIINDTTADNWKANAKQWFNASVTMDFAGTLDGAGHTVSGLYYYGTGFVALFPKAKAATIKNIRISSSYLENTGTSDNSHNVSGIVSQVNGAVTVDSCIVDETVTLISAKSVAGIAGYGSSDVTITNCGVAASITGSRRPGAMFSDFWGGTQTINNSYSVGTALTTYRANTGANNYSTAAGSGTGVTVLTAEEMSGANALNNMSLLTGFGTTDSYPVIYQQGTKGAVWSGSIATEYARGSGTKIDPYIIETGEQLVKLVKDPNTSGKYFAITADIKLNDTTAENWTETAKQWFGYNAAAEVKCKFAGTLNGEGNTISGLYYNGSDYYVGLFGAVGPATINSVIIDDSYLATSNATGKISAFTGYVNGAINYNECVVGANVTISGDHASGYGSWNTGNVTINSCMALADVAGVTYGGAFFADIWSSTLKISNSIGIGTFSPRRSYTGSNNYGTVGDNYGVNIVTAEQMQGMTALENMPLLTGYFATEGYPVRYNDGVAGATWSGGIATSFASGDGSKANPYVIKTGEQLARMLTVASNDVYFKLGADIVLSDETESHNWLDSTKAVVFSGELNGNGYIISGLNYNATATGSIYAGLIPTANGAYISNIILEDSIIDMLTNTSQATYVGGIVGYITGETNLYSCYVAESVELYNKLDESSAEKKNALGGLLGGGNSAFTIDGCAFFGTLDGFDYRYGAVFGDVWNVTDSNRIVKYTMVDNYVPSSRWGFSGSHNVSTVAPAMISDTIPTDVDSSFTVTETLKGEEGFKVADIANWNGRYFGTEGYPVLSSLGKRFGDVNGDRIFNSIDFVVMKKNLLGASVLGYIDINDDGQENILDLINIKKKISISSIDGYQLVWFDEFDGTSLDETKWNTSQTRMSDTTELAQSNLGSVRSVSDGNLQLNALKNQWYEEGSDDYFKSHKYMTTGSVSTEGKMSYQYGYLEIRAKVPYKEGCWPSFWLRSHNSLGKQENPDFEVEVDVFEVFGNTTSMASNLHQQGYDGSSYKTSTSAINNSEIHTFDDSTNLSNEYHLYAFEWEPDRMAIYVDGNLQCEWSINRWSLFSYGLKPNTSGFDTTMNILFNNHLFTSSSSYLTSESNIIENYEDNLPAEFDIDYVRLYQKNDGLSKLIIGQ